MPRSVYVPVTPSKLRVSLAYVLLLDWRVFVRAGDEREHGEGKAVGRKSSVHRHFVPDQPEPVRLTWSHSTKSRASAVRLLDSAVSRPPSLNPKS